MTNNIDTVQVVESFCKTLKKVGYRKVMNAMRSLCSDATTDKELELEDFIINTACNYYKINEDDLKQNYSTPEVFVCRNLIIVLLKKHGTKTHAEISKIFNKKGHAMVSHALSDFKNKNYKIKADSNYLSAYDTINQEVLKFKRR